MIADKRFICILLLCIYVSRANITGIVFRDFNFNGVKDSREVGVSGVYVFLELGPANNMTAVTNSDGSFSFVLGDNLPYRLTVVGLPSYLSEGLAQSSSMSSYPLLHFGTSPSNGLMFPVSSSSDYCTSSVVTTTDPDYPLVLNRPNVQTVTTCFVGGDQTSLADPVVVAFPYAAGDVPPKYLNGFATNGSPNKQKLASAADVGSVWGLAFHRPTHTLFTSAFQKRYVSYKNNDNSKTGVIYAINLTNFGAPEVSPFIDLANYGINTGNLLNPAPHGSDFQIDNEAWDHVGKISLGGITISSDYTTLFVMDLMNKQVVSFPIGVNLVAPAALLVTRHPVPVPSVCNPSGVDTRPFAVKYRDGLLYVGVVCSGEASNSPASLYASVLTLDIDADFWETVLSFPLNYARGQAGDADVSGTNTICPSSASRLDAPPAGTRSGRADWRPWTRDIVANPLDSFSCFYPQPILSDIEFGDTTDQIILGFMDRFGHQSGNSKNDLGVFDGVSAGDILCAAKNLNTGDYSIESNAVCGIKHGGKTWTNLRNGNNNGQGPNGGEFFSSDFFYPSHEEVALGGLASFPGSGEVLSSVFDPLGLAGESGFRSGGIHWYPVDDGNITQWLQIYQIDEVNTFGKASGLGDVELLCGQAPLQISGRLWSDDNSNGIQDIGEPHAPSGVVTVTLRNSNGNIVTTAVVNPSGEFNFPSGILPRGSQFTLTVSTPAGYTPSPSNQGSNDNYDSDAVSNGTTLTISGIVPPLGSTGSTTTYGFGLVPSASSGSISGRVFDDMNKNNRNDAEPGIRVTVVVNNGNNVFVSAGPTAIDGSYGFSALPAGSYKIGVPLNHLNLNGRTPSLFDSSVPTNMNSDGVPGTIVLSDGSTVPAQVVVVTILPSATNIDFGFYPANVNPPTQLNVRSTVFCDRNGNGVYDWGEPGVYGLPVELVGSSGVVIQQTMTDSTGAYSLTVNPNAMYTVRINIDANSDVIQFPSMVGQGNPAYTEKGRLRVINGVSYSVISLNTGVVNITDAHFGFYCTKCEITTNLFHQSQFVDPFPDCNDYDRLYDGNDAQEQSCFTYEDNLRVTVRNWAGSACISISAPHGVSINNFNFLAISSPSWKPNGHTVITSATSGTVDVTKLVSLQNYTSGSQACARSNCQSYDPLSSTSNPLSSNDLVICTGCSSGLQAPLEVCIAGASANDFALATVKASFVGCNNFPVNVFGVLPSRCEANNKRCNGLEAEVLCDVQCNNKLPVEVYTSVPQSDVVCVNVAPMKGLTGRVDLMSFAGAFNPLKDPNTHLYSVTANGNQILGRVALEHFVSGMACSSTSISCGTFDSQNLHSGDVNLCFGCGVHESWTGYNDDYNHDNTLFPLQVCFTRPGLTEVQFENAIVKMSLSNINGFCSNSAFGVTGILSPCTPLDQNNNNNNNNDDGLNGGSSNDDNNHNDGSNDDGEDEDCDEEEDIDSHFQNDDNSHAKKSKSRHDNDDNNSHKKKVRKNTNDDNSDDDNDDDDYDDEEELLDHAIYNVWREDLLRRKANVLSNFMKNMWDNNDYDDDNDSNYDNSDYDDNDDSRKSTRKHKSSRRSSSKKNRNH